MLFPSFFNAGPATYEIEQSLRFDGSSYMTRTPASNGSLSTWTYSTWVKYGDVAGSIVNTLISTKATVTPYGQLLIRADQELGFYQRNSGNTDSSWQKYSSNKLRDPSAWYHFLFVLNTGDSTVNNRQRMWINGVEVTSFSSDYKPGSADNSAINSTQEHMIGAYRSSSIAGYMKGYMAETHFVDGTALDPDDFGELDNNGVWRPKRYTGTYGTNGFYLKFDPSAANGIGHDHSGNGNNWTASGFTTSGTGTDVMSDTPTTNCCTLNPLSIRGALTLSEGNLKVTQGTSGWSNSQVWGTIGVTSGKYYWEITKANAALNYSMYGVATKDVPATEQYSAPTESWTYISSSGNKFGDGSGGAGTSYGASYSSGDVIGVALDMDNGTLAFYKNGSSQGTAFTSLTGKEVFPYISMYDTSDYANINFGQRDFAYTPPTGFKALNTSNLPAPTIKDGSDYFQTVLYTGNGADRNIDVADNSDNNWQPDLVWIKHRSGASDHRLFDQVRGGGAVIRSNNTNAEQTAADDGIYFTYADGFNIDYGTNGANYNGSGQTYVAWNWLAGNGTSSNTDGSITSTVSANPTAGFSIVSYTGNGTSGATVGHGLGVAASMLIVKNRDRSDANIRWAVYHRETGNTDVLYLNETNAAAPSSAFWNDTTPTSTVFTIGTDNDVNTSGDAYIAYCFAEVKNYSKFGVYTGNGSSDGTFVYCGFRPAWVLIKVTNIGTTNWIVFDSVRQTYNVIGPWLMPSSNAAEIDSDYIDFLSNGFKLRVNNNLVNSSSGTYIFAAFAEHPTGGSGVSPATAR